MIQLFSRSLRCRNHEGCDCRWNQEKWFQYNLKWLRHVAGNGSGNAYGSLTAPYGYMEARLYGEVLNFEGRLSFHELVCRKSHVNFQSSMAAMTTL